MIYGDEVIKIDFLDVKDAASRTAIKNSVEKAIELFACRSDSVASGVIHGPYSDRSKRDVNDFAYRALIEGSDCYVDSSDGRLARFGDGKEVVWTEKSVIRIVCPDMEDALERPDIFAVMAKVALEIHDSRSDIEEWKEAIAKIRRLADAISDI